MSEMAWTFKKPAVAGWYWHRYMFKGRAFEQVVEIYARCNGKLVMSVAGSDEDLPIHDDDQWAGPLEPPR